MLYKALIADDSATVRENLKAILSAQNMDVTEASNGVQALEFAQNNPPNILFLDVMMPGMDGFKVCRSMKRLDAAIPVVMVTSRNSQSDKVNARLNGAIGFVTKPFSAETIQQNLPKWLAGEGNV